MKPLRWTLAALFAAALPFAAPAQDDTARARERLVREIAADARETAPYTGRTQFSPRVMDALTKVPRHLFVPPDQRPYAYENRPLPIGHGQTISQPYIVALMSEFADVQPGQRVLEIGTGSGYQAAVLAEMGAEVHTIEIVEAVGRAGAQALRDAGYGRVRTRIGDGYAGWPEAAPFDAVLVTAAAPEIPAPLVAQLKPGGRLVIPVGARGETQQLMVGIKRADGTLETRRTIPVRFVPLTREAR
jgi:protein-L-isoaspartate(D-aspartate) O-methyltransferase